MAVKPDKEVTVIVPTAYLSVVGNYINFLHGKASSITVANKLADCLLMNHYFADIDYADFLIQQLYQTQPLWSRLFSEVVKRLTDSIDAMNSNGTGYDSLTLDNVLRDIWLRTPFNLIADDIKFQVDFLHDWLKLQQQLYQQPNVNNGVIKKRLTVDKVDYDITIDSNNHNFTVAYTIPNDISDGSDSSTVNSRRVDSATSNNLVVAGDRVEVDYLYHDNFTLRQEAMAVNGCSPHGVFRSWYEEGVLAQQTNYLMGSRHGSNKLWYRNGKLKLLEHYHNDELEGDSISYHADGVTVLAAGSYHHDRRVGAWKIYDYYTKLTSSGNYRNGNRVGHWLVTNNYGIIVEQLDY